MTTICGDGYLCSCLERDKCDEFCPVYRARENVKYGNSMIQVTEKEYEEMKKAELLAVYMKDILRMLEEIQK